VNVSLNDAARHSQWKFVGGEHGRYMPNSMDAARVVQFQAAETENEAGGRRPSRPGQYRARSYGTAQTKLQGADGWVVVERARLGRRGGGVDR
jgi:hypothetical protein